MANDDQFTAEGPAWAGAGKKNAAFSTASTDSTYGINVQGWVCGVYGESIPGDKIDPDPESDREATVGGVGVQGIGQNFGVYGKGVRNPITGEGAGGKAGVFGEHAFGGVAIVGAAMRGGTGIIGASVYRVGNPLRFLDGASLRKPADGSGTGVFGTSGSGFGVHGSSNSGPGGVFESTDNAQIRLPPRVMESPEGSVAGAGGELLATIADGVSRLGSALGPAILPQPGGSS